MTMVLADTSIWVAHFRKANPTLEALLLNDQIICHPLVALEIACGSPPSPRAKTLYYLKGLQQAKVATSAEILEFIEKNKLFDSGCGAIDISLLASSLISENTLLWTLDKQLDNLALPLGISFNPQLH